MGSCKDARGVASETARRFMPPSFGFVKTPDRNARIRTAGRQGRESKGVSPERAARSLSTVAMQSASSSTTTNKRFLFQFVGKGATVERSSRSITPCGTACLYPGAATRSGSVIWQAGRRAGNGATFYPVPAFAGSPAGRPPAWSDDKQRRRVSCLQLTSALRQ